MTGRNIKMSDYDDYNENLFFEPDYSIYQMARKLIKLSKERNLNMHKDKYNLLNFNRFCVSPHTRKIYPYVVGGEPITQAKSNKHLYNIIEVLTRP